MSTPNADDWNSITTTTMATTAVNAACNLLHHDSHEQLLIFYLFPDRLINRHISSLSLHLLTCSFLNHIPCFNHRRRRTHGRLLHPPTLHLRRRAQACEYGQQIRIWICSKRVLILEDFRAVTCHFDLASLINFILYNFLSISSST